MPKYRALRDNTDSKGLYHYKNDVVESAEPPSEHWRKMDVVEVRLNNLQAADPFIKKYLAKKEELEGSDPEKETEEILTARDPSNRHDVLARQRRIHDQLKSDLATLRAALTEEQLRALGEMKSVDKGSGAGVK